MSFFTATSLLHPFSRVPRTPYVILAWAAGQFSGYFNWGRWSPVRRNLSLYQYAGLSRILLTPVISPDYPSSSPNRHLEFILQTNARIFLGLGYVVATCHVCFSFRQLSLFFPISTRNLGLSLSHLRPRTFNGIHCEMGCPVRSAIF